MRPLSAVILLGLVSARPPGALTVPNCAAVSDCAETACAVDCNEPALRAAVAQANDCAGEDGFQRTITFNFGCGGCTVNMNQAPSETVAVCPEDPLTGGRYAVCIKTHGLVIDGQSRVLFNYSGPYACADCSGACEGSQPALFTVKGHHNVLRNFAMQFFPEGIHLRDDTVTHMPAHDNLIENVRSAAVCEEAITVDSPDPSPAPGAPPTGGHTIRRCTFTGHTGPSPRCYKEKVCSLPAGCTSGVCSGGRCACTSNADCASGQVCHCSDGSFAPPEGPCPSAAGTCYVTSSRCGLDKAIQVNGGSVTIGDADPAGGNTIDAFGQPVSVQAGTHMILGNRTNGLGTTPSGEACAGYPDSCTQPGTDNCDDTCQAYTVDGGTATFAANTIDYCKYGIRVRGNGVAYAAGNTLRYNFMSAFFVGGSGWLVGEGNAMKDNGCYTGSSGPRGALVGATTAAHVDFGGGDAGGACLPIDGSCTTSAGGNAFCQEGTLVDVDTNGAASIGARGNCFDDEPPPSPVIVGTVPTSPAFSCGDAGFSPCSGL